MKHKILQLAIVVVTVAAIAACNYTSGPGPVTPSCKPPTPDAQIPLPLAPAVNRVDLGVPAFSDPTDIDNPLFPIRTASSSSAALMDRPGPRRGDAASRNAAVGVGWTHGRDARLAIRRRPRRPHPRVALDSTPRTMSAPSGISARTSSTTRTAKSPTRTAPGWPARTARPR